MRAKVMQLRLISLQGGAYTQLRLQGPVPTAPQPQQVRRLLTLLARWHGGPIDVVLSAADPSFSEVWTDALCAVPERHLRVRFVLDRERAVEERG